MSVWARSIEGQWHIATTTYPNAATTLCGQRLECDVFLAESQSPPPREPACDTCQWVAGNGLPPATDP